MKNFLLTILMLTGSYSMQAQWINTGANGISNGWTNYNDIAVDENGWPVVAYYDISLLEGVCLRYDGNNWVNPHAASFNFPIGGDLKLLIDKNNHYYLFFKDKNNGFPSVVHYDGTAWNYYCGQYISQQSADYYTIEFDNNGILHAVIIGQSGFEFLKADNGTWQNLPTNFTGNAYAYPSLKFDNTNTAHLAFCNINTLKACCVIYNGTGWLPVGNMNASSGFAKYIKLMIDNKNQKYMAYEDGYTTCMKLDTINNVWTGLGNAGLDNNRTGIEDMVCDRDEKIYISTSASGNDKARCIVFDNNSWHEVGNTPLSDTLAGYPAIALNENGILYTIYNDYIQEKAMVKSYNTSLGSEEEINTQIGAVYPNPVHDNLNIQLNEYNEFNYYEMLNSNGKLIAQGKITGIQYSINTSDLNSGLYFLRLRSANGIQTLKFLKSN